MHSPHTGRQPSGTEAFALQLEVGSDKRDVSVTDGANLFLSFYNAYILMAALLCKNVERSDSFYFVPPSPPKCSYAHFYPQ